MYAGTRVTGRNVNDEITDLAIEVVLIRVPIPIGPVRVRVDHGDTCEAGCCFEGGESNCIANKLSIIILYQWRADKVCSRWEVDQSWGYGTGIAALTTAVAIGDGGINGCGVVRRTVASRAIVLDIAIDFERRVAKCNGTLPLYVGDPVR